VTRIADAANQEAVLDVALATTGAQLERICRGFRKATALEAKAAADRRVRARVLGSGLVKLEIVVAADEADLLIKAIESAREQLTPGAPQERPSAAVTKTKSATATGVAPRPSAADALVHLASVHLAGRAPHAATPEPEHHQVIIHVDRDLTSAEPTLAATLTDGTPVSAETLRRVACDSGLVAAAVGEQGAVLDVGRRTRAIPTAIRRALWIRDQGCRFPGCANDRFLHGHHVKHWLHGGPTALDNLVLLCSFHHQQVHEGGFTLSLSAAAEVEVRTPEGVLLATQPGLAPDLGAVDWNGDWWNMDGGGGGDVAIDAWTATPAWDGEPVDYEAAVGALVPN
jgi:hypothetical protein